MVNMKKFDDDSEIEVTSEDDTDKESPELEEIEERSEEKLKKLRQQLAACEDEKKAILDESLRGRADFMNARKRLEDERRKDRMRFQRRHVEELLPLCDSFEMAMGDVEIWEKADQSWRTGIEGIYAQLKSLLGMYGVRAFSPAGEAFDPHRHDAVGTEVVTDESRAHTVVVVVQPGYEMTADGETEIIRPARVTTGIINDE